MKKIRTLIAVFIAGLVVSGVSAVPLEYQLSLILGFAETIGIEHDYVLWLQRVYDGIVETNHRFPFMAYGTDWLAFAHIVIAVAFIGPFRDPQRNIWVIEFGMIACGVVLPFAFVAGRIRDIPMIHQLIDCSFGVIGFTILYFSYKLTRQLDVEKSHAAKC
jgi:hypothetical protein